MTRILYLVHDLNDPAVERRARMFVAGGADVAVAGFHRAATPPAEIAGAGVVSLGRTHDGALARRALSIAARMVAAAPLKQVARKCDVIVARNLEMLVLAHRVRRPRQRVIYECLDIHRTMLGGSLVSTALRGLERALVRRSSLVIISSPAFGSRYFEAVQNLPTPRLLVENKLFPGSVAAPREIGKNHGPVRIGWFGNLRCRRSLAILKTAAAQSDWLKVLVAGRPSPAEFPRGGAEFDAPGIEYVGPYAPSDLPALYGRCDFAWCIDYFEDGLNSEWLLPNRIYEATANRVVPIAREGTETAAWLRARDIGLVIPRSDELEFLTQTPGKLGPDALRALQSAVNAVPAGAVVASAADCQALVGALGS